MKRLRGVLTLLFSIITLCLSAQVQTPVKWSFEAEEMGKGEFLLVATAKIDSSWYIYDLIPYKDGPTSTSLSLELPKGAEKVGSAVVTSEIIRKYDPIWQSEIGKLYKEATIEQKIVVGGDKKLKIAGSIEWQTCSETSCLPPESQTFSFEIQGGGEDISAQLNGGKNENSSSLWATILAAILWGFAAVLTPCVFPMVPVTISYFLKNSGSKSRGKLSAMAYGLSIVALYTLPIVIIIALSYFIGGESIMASSFNFLATHWIPNLLFFAMFILFAASLMGAFEISLPSKLIDRSDKGADKSGFMGIFFMALTLVLVSFSCTGPIVGAVLVGSTQGEIWEPIVTMVAFSTAFALPFTFFALFPSLLKKLPKSGGWLSSVKVTLGFIELALALKFLSIPDLTYHWGILPREVYLAIWIVIFAMLGFYLLGKLRLKGEEKIEEIGVKRLFLSMAVFAFVVYMIPGMFGAPLKALSGYLPPLKTDDFNMSNSTKEVATAKSDSVAFPEARYSDFLQLPYGLNGFFNYTEGLEYAKDVKKPIFLEFTGHGCVNCREMESKVWSDPKVLDILRQKYVIIALYTDDKTELAPYEWKENKRGKKLKSLGEINAQFQIDRFGVNAQPYYVILDENGEELGDAMGYDTNIEKFQKFLENGVELFNSKGNIGR